MPQHKSNKQDAELQAMATVYQVLADLDSDAQHRVLDYVIKRLSLTIQVASGRQNFEDQKSATASSAEGPSNTTTTDPAASVSSDLYETEGLEGISPVAQKWMRRNGLSAGQLSRLFSLGVDEIDLVAKSVPGKSTREKFLNVLLLQGIGSYLGSGVARVDAGKVRQTAAHYGADPGRNLWNYVKSAASEVSGSSSTGFTLTARGLTSATDLVKQIASAKS